MWAQKMCKNKWMWMCKKKICSWNKKQGHICVFSAQRCSLNVHVGISNLFSALNRYSLAAALFSQIWFNLCDYKSPLLFHKLEYPPFSVCWETQPQTFAIISSPELQILSTIIWVHAKTPVFVLWMCNNKVNSSFQSEQQSPLSCLFLLHKKRKKR